MTKNTKKLIEETIESYYEYVVNIEGGCNLIIQSLKGNNLEVAMKGIVALSEGLSWLLDTEYLLEKNSYKIDSPVAKISPLFSEINSSLGANNIKEVINLLELDLKPLFANASSWKFEEIVN